MASSGVVLNSQAGTSMVGGTLPIGLVPGVSVILGGTPVLAQINTYVPVTGSTSVTLPGSANPGDRVTILNLAATAVPLLVFPNTAAGIINSGAAGGSFSVAQNKSAQFIKSDAENWIAVLSA